VTNVGYKQKFARAKDKIQNEEAEVRRTIKRYMASGKQDDEIKHRITDGFSVLLKDKSKWRDNLVRDKERYLSAYMAEYYQQQMKEQAIEQNVTHFERTMSEGIGGTGIDQATYLANPELIPAKYRGMFTP
jgi:hypothetical protein